MKKIIQILPVIVATALSANAQSVPSAAEPAAFQASLTPDIAIEAKDTRINGVALSIWGQNPQSALALGFINGSTGESKGFTWGLVNYTESYNGVAWAFANFNNGTFNGWEDGLLNYSQGSFTGLQSGWVNISEEFNGLQIGLLNYAKQLDGVQIGFVNVALNNPWFSEFPDKLATGFPIVNWSF
jgi:hypothetical protein